MALATEVPRPETGGRPGLKADIRGARAAADGFSVQTPEPHDYRDHAERLPATVLPRFEPAHQRGVMAERSRAGYRALRAGNALDDARSRTPPRDRRRPGPVSLSQGNDRLVPTLRDH